MSKCLDKCRLFLKIGAFNLTFFFWLLLLFMLLGLSGQPAAAQNQSEAVAGFNESLPTEVTTFPLTLDPGFTFIEVKKLARNLAARAYVKPDNQTAKFLSSFSEDQWKGITLKDENKLWGGENLPFEVGFFHPGFIFDHTVTLYVIDNGQVHPVVFNRSYFNYLDPGLEEKIGSRILNFAGFRLYFPINGPNNKEEFAAFLGATHFRALARHATYGLTARGLILNPATAGGEEFPYFLKFWLVKPTPQATSMTIYALMDSPSLSGAYSFVITPGTATIMDVSVRLYPRVGVMWPQKVGVAALSGMYLFSEKENGSRTDWRPEVHSADNLLVSTWSKAWFSRPLKNPERLKINEFNLEHPRGFGLVQRDDNFDHYQDITARFDRRSWLWIEPKEDWSRGRLELIEIPSTQEIHDNILAFWIPERPLAGEDFPADTSLAFDYRLYWMAPGITPHQLGRVVSTRLLQLPERETIQLNIDFENEELKAIPAEIGLASQVETNAEYPILEKSLLKNPVTGGWRLELKIRRPRGKSVVENLMLIRDERTTPRFQIRLVKGENLPESLTETWLYDLVD
ncbi:MAG: hypothetical protein AMR96_04535 [Candidatus Adiutrix intracellularis]|nr:MAG: hypothetical protein AMR96_04535 [Candidatus Adiutrix intracellularis]